MRTTPALRWLLLAVGVTFALLGTTAHVGAAPQSVTTVGDYFSRCWDATCTLAVARPEAAGPLSPPLLGPWSAEAWLGTAAGEVLVTEDGGISWTLHELPNEAAAVVGLFALAPEGNGGEERVFALDERGRSWRFERDDQTWVEADPGEATATLPGVDPGDIRWRLVSRTRWGATLALPAPPPAGGG